MIYYIINKVTRDPNNIINHNLSHYNVIINKVTCS